MSVSSLFEKCAYCKSETVKGVVFFNYFLNAAAKNNSKNLHPVP